MLRFFPLVLIALVACNSPKSEQIDNRSENVQKWAKIDQLVDASGFTKKSRSHIYGSPYVLVSEFQIDLDAGSQYAIVDEEFSHRCGDDEEVTHEYAIVRDSGELTIARQIQGVTGFDKNPGGVVTLQAIVFASRFCQIPKFDFKIMKAAFAKESAKTECEAQEGMRWDGHACIKGPELLCQEKENYLFIDDKCVPRTTGEAPTDLLGTAWKQINQDDAIQWIFQFTETGNGVFGFADGELTIKSGTVGISTDFEIDESHVILRIVDGESLPDNSRWKTGTFHYCRYSIATSDDQDTPTQMSMSCAEANQTALPLATSDLLEFELVDAADTSFDQE